MPSDRHDGQHSFALLLALWYVALVVYASLYPFHSWRDQGVSPWDYLWAPWPRYWTLKDVLANLAGYVPLGFLITWAGWRRGGRTLPALGRPARQLPGGTAQCLARRQPQQ